MTTVSEYRIYVLEIIWQVFLRLVISLLILFLFIFSFPTAFSSLNTGNILFLLFMSIILLFLWLSLFFKPYKFIIHDEKLIIKAVLRSYWLTINDLLSVKETAGGKKLRLDLGHRHLTVYGAVKNKDAFYKILKNINLAIVIKKFSMARKIFGATVKVTVLLIIVIGILWISDPRAFGDRQKVIKSLEKYHQKFSEYPVSLQELKARMPGLKFKYAYYYTSNKKAFIVYYTGGLIDNDHYFSSDTKKWIFLSFQHKDPNYQHYKALVQHLKSN